MSRVTADIHIAAPPERVWRYALDPEHLGEWVTIHRKIHRADPGPPHEGMRMEQTLCLRGVNFKVKWELTKCEDAARAVWEGRGPMHSHARTEYELIADGDGGTRFHYVNEFRAPGGPMGAAASRVLVGGLPEREAHRSLQALKELVENGT
jgi:uncharacterized protein YndB with AHSA1/START domain